MVYRLMIDIKILEESLLKYYSQTLLPNLPNLKKKTARTVIENLRTGVNYLHYSIRKLFMKET